MRGLSPRINGHGDNETIGELFKFVWNLKFTILSEEKSGVGKQHLTNQCALRAQLRPVLNFPKMRQGLSLAST